jgi:hypothetical protein
MEKKMSNNRNRMSDKKSRQVNRQSQSDVEKRIKNSVLASVRSSSELKWLNVAALSNPITATTYFADLTNISQGSTSGTRNGDTVRLVKLRFAWSCIVGDPTNVVRITIIKWLMNTTSDVPAQSEIFQDTSTGPRAVLCPFVPNQPSRFRVLHDSIHSLDTLAHPQLLGVINMKLGFETEFDQGANTGRNHVYICLTTDSSVTPHPAFSHESMVWFTDD